MSAATTTKPVLTPEMTMPPALFPRYPDQAGRHLGAASRQRTSALRSDGCDPRDRCFAGTFPQVYDTLSFYGV